ncbi:ell-associated factor Eaf [Anthonomus grandis grandis]|uniref:ell-associated factor Eaf n=1 Tax=Anthonomus grandis grandis TaxID=2921223 RepID=UPI0021655493|nr:ell-associated factor Eaf [Anthonomus grandis grandis]
MAEKLGLGTEERVLKIGQSFTNPRSKAFHTVRYDFKPASVDTNKKATLDVGDNSQVTVTVPHLDGAGTTQTVFKGSQRPYTKECVLIIDRVTGELTLEKLTCNIQLKKTRSALLKSKGPPLPQDRLQSSHTDRASGASGSTSLAQRAATPPVNNVVGHRVSNKTRVTSGSRRPDRPITQLLPKHSPLRASPGHPSPNAGIGNHQRSPGRSSMYGSTNESHNPSTLASLPMIGMDDFADPTPPPTSQPAVHHNSRLSAPPPQPPVNNGKGLSPLSDHSDNENGVGTMSDSSSSSSDSDSDSDTNDNVKMKNGYGNVAPAAPPPSKVNGHDLATLDEDLCLSESGSDSD